MRLGRFLLRHGVDLAWGRKLYQRLRAHGLTNVQVDGTLQVYEGGFPGARLMQANYDQICEEAANAGLIGLFAACIR